jgi:dihydrolipoamide dehydrogenase
MDVSLSVEKNLLSQGVKVYTNSEVQCIENVKEGKTVTIVNEGATHTLNAQVVVFAMGHSPSVKGLGLADIGVKFDERGIRTNRRMETNVDGIYAVGDVTGEIMLASVGIVQGMVAAQNAMGGNETIDYRLVPRIIRTIPEVGAIGLTEQEAKNQQIDINVGKYPLKKNAKAFIQKDRGGFVKMIADATTEEILGLHILGSQASELIHGALMIMQTRATIRDVAKAIHGHPCLHEAINRAALGMCH